MPIDDIAERLAARALSKNDFDATLSILMKRYGTEIWRNCRSIIGNEADAHDVRQVVFVQAFRDLPRFSGKSSFRTWLYAICRHRCLDHLKRERRLRDRVEFVDEPPDAGATDDLSPDSSDTGLERILRLCLARLSGRERMEVLMRYQSEMSFTELAEIVGDKPGTIQARVVRALPKLRRCVREHGASL